MSRGKTIPQRFKGKRVAFTGELAWRDYGKDIVQSEGGSVGPLSVKTDILVAEPNKGRQTGNEKKARKWVNDGKAAIQVVDEATFLDMVLPSREETLLLWSRGKKGVERWQHLSDAGYARKPLDLRDCDLRGLKLAGIDAKLVRLDGADLRDADVSHANFDNIKGANFSGAKARKTSFAYLTKCDLKKADLTDGYASGGRDSDFSHANLTRFEAWFADFSGAKLYKANCKQIDLNEAKLKGVDFRGANLEKAILFQTDLRGANLSGAKLAKADLSKAKLAGANLSKADLRGATLSGADLRKANVTGADFTDAILIDAILTGLDKSKARGLDRKKSAVGKNLKALSAAMNKALSFETKVRVDLDKGYVDLFVAGNATGAWFQAEEKNRREEWTYGTLGTVAAAMMHVGSRFARRKPQLGKMKSKASKSPIKGKALQQLFAAAWCEALELDPAAYDPAEGRAHEAAISDQLLGELRGGAKGVKKWNARTRAEKSRAVLKGVDLSGAKLAGADFTQLDLRGANLSGANLSRARLVLTELRQVDLSNANLTKANLSDAELLGCDLRGAVLKGVIWDDASFDEKTRWSGDVPATAKLIYIGKGADPRAKQRVAKKGAKRPATFDAFFEALRGKVDKARLDKAMKMLKADSFQLFSDVDKDALIGVVKSQTDAKLIYSCRLGADGSFSCCTQNINACGGLRGALCKHLLVLIVGLSKAGELKPGVVDDWVDLSQAQAPALDKDLMSETFLRYKGAEAGELDWRPTETVPEDFYAF